MRRSNSPIVERRDQDFSASFNWATCSGNHEPFCSSTSATTRSASASRCKARRAFTRSVATVSGRLLAIEQALAVAVGVDVVVRVGRDQLRVQRVEFGVALGAREVHAQVVGGVAVLLQVVAQSRARGRDRALEHGGLGLGVAERGVEIGRRDDAAALVGTARVGHEDPLREQFVERCLLRREQGAARRRGLFLAGVEQLSDDVGAIAADVLAEHALGRLDRARFVFGPVGAREFEAVEPQRDRRVLRRAVAYRLRQGGVPVEPGPALAARLERGEHVGDRRERSPGGAALQRVERGRTGEDPVDVRIERPARLLGEDAAELGPVLVEQHVGRQRPDLELLHPGVAVRRIGVDLGDDGLPLQRLPLLAVQHVRGHEVARVAPRRTEIDQHRLVRLPRLREGLVDRRRPGRVQRAGQQQGEQRCGDRFHFRACARWFQRNEYDSARMKADCWLSAAAPWPPSVFS